MEQNLPIITKKLWNIVRLAFFMLKKGICKKKILFNLNMMMKRGKIATKIALNNLIFHHYNNHLHAFTMRSAVHQPSHLQQPTTDATREYIFKGGATPLYFHRPTNNKKRGYQCQEDYFYSCMSSPNFEDIESLEVVNKAMEVMLCNTKKGVIVRQVRITDSPFPLQSEESYDHYVDKAADNFIKKFYSRLKEQE